MALSNSPAHVPLSGSASTATRTLRILVAEDNLFNRKLLIQMLRHLGYEADQVSNGAEVLDTLRQQTYDVVLMDVQMPVLDGLAATRLICQEWPTESRPHIIGVTGRVTAQDLEHCTDSGMDACINKPIRLEALAELLLQYQPRSHSTPGHAIDLTALSPAPLDRQALDDVRQSGGDEGDRLLASVIEVYLEETPMLLRQLREAIAQNQTAQAQWAAQALGTTSSTLGAIRLAYLCQEIETRLNAGTLTASPALLGQLEMEGDRAQRALRLECQTP